MRRLLILGGFSIGALLLGHTAAQACGDKLLTLSRGVRFQRAYAAARPASILIYSKRNAGTTHSEADLRAALKQAGHKLHVVEDVAQAEQLLRSQAFDVVLTDLAEADALAQRAQAAPSKPIVLPVLNKPTKSELAAAQKKYSRVLRTSDNPGDYLVTIEAVMKTRAHSAHS